MKWQYQNTTLPQSFEELSTILLKNRAITDVDTFFNRPHPSTLGYENCGISKEEVVKAHARFAQAKEKKETVVIFGDYDADGITATAIVWLALREYGILAQPFIPLRDKHGYGLSVQALEEVLTTFSPDLIVTVDNGIVAHTAAEFLESKGVDLILTDHHQAEERIPPATAVVHTTDLCGATVGWMLVHTLVSEAFANSLLDLAGIATIADQVPLLGANRAFAFYGIKEIQKTNRRGITSLLQSARVKRADVDSGTVGYVLAPRINAMGRLAHGLDALRLLCSQSPKQIASLTHTLTDTNSQRQELTKDLFQEALEQAKIQQDEHVIVVYSASFHEGVIGLIAGRLVEYFSKPAIVLSISDATAKASVRSVPGIHITNFLRKFKGEMTSLGGHPMAAGFGVEKEHMVSLIDHLQTEARSTIDATLLEQSLTVEARIPQELISLEMLNTLEKFAPFGSANEYPVFALHDVPVVSARAMGKDMNHLLLSVGVGENEPPLKIVGWRKASLLKTMQVGQSITIAGYFEKNVWKEKVSLQFILTDIQKEA